MANFSKSTYLSYDREQLLNTIARFDDGIQVEDVVGPENESDNLKQYSNTVLIQVLLEFACCAFVKDEIQKERLLLEACKRLSQFKIMNDLLIVDKSHELRIAMKEAVINFLKQICKEIIPSSELDINALPLFESKSLSADVKLYYCKNFIELEKIAQGGFGAVFKAEYKLNKLIYAVKKIPFDYRTDANFLMVMREANNIATLSHDNVVRYFSAWIEIAETDAAHKSRIDNDRFTSDLYKDDRDGEFNGLVIMPSNESSKCLSKNDENSDCENSSYVIFSESAEVSITSNNVNWTMGNDSLSSDDSNDSNSQDDKDYSSLNFKIQGTLYIQMEYCDCDLSLWLDKRAETKGEELPFKMTVTEIFRNILNGVAHIHSKGIIHRDLKPRNIFYSKSSNTLKIGDFGLATLSGITDISSSHASHDHSSAIGTIPYAAPEQLKSKKYDMKVDIYSLGIILIELMNVCTTRSEFHHIIEEVKDGKINEEMTKFPNLVKLPKILISNNSEERLSAKEILNLFDKEDMNTANELVVLKKTIKNMEEALLQKDLEIARLNKIILEMKMNYK